MRIVRKLAQYFYPQGQTKVMNEGWATFWHYTILNRLYETGHGRRRLHARVPEEPHQRRVPARRSIRSGYGGINPYALGFAMFSDMRRICEQPTAEDRDWFPDIAGSDWRKMLDFAMRNFKDESFIAQYLSPRLIREFRLFAIADHARKARSRSTASTTTRGYRRVRKLLAQQHTRENRCRTSRSSATTATATAR